MKKIFFDSNKHDRLFKSLRTFACAKENELPLHRNKPEHEGICRSEEILCLLNTYETCLCSVLYVRWDVFDELWFFAPLLLLHSTTPHSTSHTPSTYGGMFVPPWNRQLPGIREKLFLYHKLPTNESGTYLEGHACRDFYGFATRCFRHLPYKPPPLRPQTINEERFLYF